MTNYEIICCNKVRNAALGLLDKNTVTKEEIKVALETLKKMTDDRNDWTEEQKTEYKKTIECAKQLIDIKDK